MHRRWNVVAVANEPRRCGQSHPSRRPDTHGPARARESPRRGQRAPLVRTPDDQCPHRALIRSRALHPTITVSAAVHVHSAWSYDGKWELAELARALVERDYRVVLMAEHSQGFDADRWDAYQRACSEVSSSRLLFVPGIEYSDPSNRVHTPVWGRIPFIGETPAVAETLQAVRSHDGTAVLAHPARRDAWRLVQPEWADHLSGVEAWNARYGGTNRSDAADELLVKYPHLIPFAGLDFHKASDLHPLGMRLELTSFTPDGVYEALAAGRCRPHVESAPAPGDHQSSSGDA
jgi:hypothetical protein